MSEAIRPTACVPPLGGNGLNPHQSVRITLVTRPTACVPPLGGTGLNSHRSVRITLVIIPGQSAFFFLQCVMGPVSFKPSLRGEGP